MKSKLALKKGIKSEGVETNKLSNYTKKYISNVRENIPLRKLTRKKITNSSKQ
jgi:hypothetical protein